MRRETFTFGSVEMPGEIPLREAISGNSRTM